MPVFDKHDRNNWYNSIRVEETPGQRARRFHAENVKGNEIQCGDAILAKIPDIPGRISRRNSEKDQYGKTTSYIEFITERYYDKEKKQSRNKRVIIGTDVSHIYHGMMIINERYHDFFDKNGHLIWRSEPPRKAETEPENTESDWQEPVIMTANDSAADPESAEVIVMPESEKEENTEDKTEEKPELPEKKTEDKLPAHTKEEAVEGDMKKELLKAVMDQMGSYSQVQPEDTGYDDGDDEYDDAEYQKAKHERDYLSFLDSLLHRYIATIETQAKKRPDKHLTVYQTRRINELLEKLREYFKESENYEYLMLAEEPTEGDPEKTGMTYADMEILLASYAETIFACKMGKLWNA